MPGGSKQASKPDSVMVGNTKRSTVDVGNAIKDLSHTGSPLSPVRDSSPAVLAGHNSTSDNINAMIDRRARLKAESASKGQQLASNQ